MALDNFIPSIWSARILGFLSKAHVYGQPGVVNRDYEGEIRNAGDTVHIHNIGHVTIFDYTKNSDMPAPEVLSDERRSLLIDQSKAFNFQIDDVDEAQQRPQVMDEAMRSAGYGLSDLADQHIASQYTAATTNNIGTQGVPIAVTASDAYTQLLDLGTLLDEANVPTEGRFVVVPPWYRGLLLRDDNFVATGHDRAEERLANAQIGQAAGFRVLNSNNVPVDTSVYKIIAGHAMAWSFAEQINSLEAYRPESRFADAVKGLHLYGAKVVREEALAVLHATRP